MESRPAKRNIEQGHGSRQVSLAADYKRQTTGNGGTQSEGSKARREAGDDSPAADYN